MPEIDVFAGQITQITDHFLQKERIYTGLLGGDLGWCIFLNELEDPSNSNFIIRNIIKKYVESSYKFDSSITYDIYKGIGSLYLTINYLDYRHLFLEEELCKLESNLFTIFEQYIHISNFDFLYGASGLLLGFIHSGYNLQVASKLYIDKLWRIYKATGTIDIFLPNSKIMNLGFAHGICGVNSLLLYLKSLDIRDERIDQLIIAIGNTLISKFKDDLRGKTLVPLAINEDKTVTYIDTLGWCTGRLAYGISLLDISHNVGEMSYGKIGKKIIDDAFLEPMNLFDFQNENDIQTIYHKLSLCHGLPSLVLLTKIIFEKTEDLKFLDRHYILRKHLIHSFHLNPDMFKLYENSLSLLQGISGIFLTALYSDQVKWRKLLLL